MTDFIEATRAEADEAVKTGHNLVAASGEVDESVIVLGIPASTTQPGSAIGATPVCRPRCWPVLTSPRSRSSAAPHGCS